MNKDLNSSPPGILELNSRSAVIKGINELRKTGDPFAAAAAQQILETGRSRRHYVDPRNMVKQVYSIWKRVCVKVNRIY